MKTTTLAALALAATLTSSNATPIIDLYEYAFNIDGVVVFYNPSVPAPPLPASVDLAGFNTSTGLGTILMRLTGTGTHYGGVYVDHEIDQRDNTYYNEFGSNSPGPVLGQSWEIDEPGYVFGDIYDNFKARTLDNSNSVPSTVPDDVSMALAWNVTLTAGDEALMTFLVSTTTPTSGFYLTQTDPDSPSPASIYFSSSLKIQGQGVPDVGSTLALLLCACGGLAGWRAVFKFLP